MAGLGVGNSMSINELCLFSLPLYLQTNDLLSLEIYIAPNSIKPSFGWTSILVLYYDICTVVFSQRSQLQQVERRDSKSWWPNNHGGHVRNRNLGHVV